jgi:GMP synthase-like glutamine amidotransferase
MIRVHSIQHVEFETPAYFMQLIQKYNLPYTTSIAGNANYLPSQDSFDLLILMGGPMNVDETDTYDWLADEKKFILDSIKKGKKIIGVCLGAQLIASCLNAKVKKNEFKEIGWFPVFKTPEAADHQIFSGLPDSFMTFHWHGDTFQIPQNCIRLAASAACSNQAFVYKDKVVGLQFHSEVTLESIGALIDNCRSELTEEKYIQTENEIIAQSKALVRETNEYLEKIFNNLINSK